MNNSSLLRKDEESDLDLGRDEADSEDTFFIHHLVFDLIFFRFLVEMFKNFIKRLPKSVLIDPLPFGFRFSF